MVRWKPTLRQFPRTESIYQVSLLVSYLWHNMCLKEVFLKPWLLPELPGFSLFRVGFLNTLKQPLKLISKCFFNKNLNLELHRSELGVTAVSFTLNWRALWDKSNSFVFFNLSVSLESMYIMLSNVFFFPYCGSSHWAIYKLFGKKILI